MRKAKHEKYKIVDNSLSIKTKYKSRIRQCIEYVSMVEGKVFKYALMFLSLTFVD